MKNKTIEELKAELAQIPSPNGIRKISDEFKKKVVAYHYKSGMAISPLAEAIGTYPATASKWKKQFGKERTGFVFGDTVRNDLRTKALAVQEIVTNGASQSDTAKKYGVGTSTMHTWLNKYKNTFEDLLDTRDGVPFLVSENKMVFGNDNIDAILKLKEEHVIELNTIIELMHKNGMTKKLISEVKSREKELKAEVEVLDKAKKIMKKTK